MSTRVPDQADHQREIVIEGARQVVSLDWMSPLGAIFTLTWGCAIPVGLMVFLPAVLKLGVGPRLWAVAAVFIAIFSRFFYTTYRYWQKRNREDISLLQLDVQKQILLVHPYQQQFDEPTWVRRTQPLQVNFANLQAVVVIPAMVATTRTSTERASLWLALKSGEREAVFRLGRPAYIKKLQEWLCSTTGAPPADSLRALEKLPPTAKAPEPEPQSWSDVE